MNLGKTIYEHRTRMNLSQGDLAELLNVSRQSVSKWENNSAVPDLEKIVKLSEIFDLSLYEFVKGEKVVSSERSQIVREVIIQHPKKEGRITAGVILMCMALVVFLMIFVLTGSIGGFIYSLPFFVCGILCFTIKTNTGLWCAWVVYFMIDVFFRFAMGITIGMVRHTLIWSADMNYARLAIAWIYLAITLLLIIWTIFTLKKKTLIVTQFTGKQLWGGWILWLVLFLIHQLIVRSDFYFTFLSYIISIPVAYTLISMTLEWLRGGLLIAMIIFTLRYRKATS